MKYHIAKTPVGDRISVTHNDGVTWFIPKDPANTDYQAYLAWLADGNEPEVIEP